MQFSQGSVAIVDFGSLLNPSDASTIPYSYNAPAYASSVTIGNLVNVSGGSTGWKLTAGGFRKEAESNNLISATAWDGAAKPLWDAYAASLGISSLDASITRDNFFMGSSSATFSLSGLAASTRYEITIGFGRYGSGFGQSATSFSLGTGTLEESSWFSSDGTSGRSATGYNIPHTGDTQVVVTYTVTANDSGNIDFSFSGAYYQAIGFVTVKEAAIPEPATTSLGFLGLSLVALRRRRL